MLDRSRINICIYSMNKLPLAKRIQIINLLVEGSSLRAASRIADVSINTVTRLLVDVGLACMEFHDENVREEVAKRVQCDEIWSFVYAKEKDKPQDVEGAGDAWTFVGIDADTKLVISWFVGPRGVPSAIAFIDDLDTCTKGKMQLTTDGFRPYLVAVDQVFPTDDLINYAMLQKMYGPEGGSTPERKYSPAVCTGAKKTIIHGQPDEKFISTSYFERQNLTMRMHMRRFIRLTNGFSKKLENHMYSIALHFVYYNFCKLHKTLRTTPAMAAHLMKGFMSLEDLVLLADKHGKKV